MLRGRQGQKWGGREMERQCLNMGIINAFTTWRERLICGSKQGEAKITTAMEITKLIDLLLKA